VQSITKLGIIRIVSRLDYGHHLSPHALPTSIPISAMVALKETHSTAKRKRPQAAEPSPGSGPSADEEINLNCWIREDSADPFRVKIKTNETVDSLKSQILEEMEVRVAKSSLILWKVSVSFSSVSSPSKLL